MKLIVSVIILALCLTPISASFFDDFRGAIVSVHHSFGRLFSDVVTDVSDTIGCTILAVKQVLALDGSYHESSDYNKKCKDRSSTPNTAYSSSITKKTENPLIDINEHNAQEEIKNLEFELKKQTDHLISISNLLKRELDNIPNEIRIKFKTTDPDPNESTVGHIWRDLKILHGIEHSHEKIPQINEIHEVLDEALQIMQINDVGSNVSDDEKIKKIVVGLEKETNDTIIDVEDQFSKWEKEEDIKEKHEINTLNEVKDQFSLLDNGESTKERDRINTITKVENQIANWEKEENTKAKEVINTINEVEDKISKLGNEKKDTKAKEVINTINEVEDKISKLGTEEETKVIDEIKNTVTDKMPKNDGNTAEDENTPNNEPVKTTTVAPNTSTQTTSTQSTSTQTESTSTTTESELDQFQEFVLSQLGPQDAKSKEEAVNEAAKIVQDSEYRNKIFNYLKSTEESGANLFENPELFNFGS